MKAEISDGGSYGKGMGSRQVIISGVKKLEGKIQVLVCNKIQDAKAWCVNKKMDVLECVGLGCIDGPIRKDGPMRLLTIYIFQEGRGQAIAIERPPSDISTSARTLLFSQPIKKIAGTRTTLVNLELKNRMGAVLLEDRMSCNQGRIELEVLPPGAIDDNLVLEGIVEAALSYTLGMEKP